jgi:hypothetical protein
MEDMRSMICSRSAARRVIMPDEESGKIYPDEFHTFARKLEGWSADLPERERAFLRVILERAEKPVPRITDFQGINAPPISRLVPRLLDEYLRCKQTIYEPDGGVWLRVIEPTWLKRTP